eukprot:tig00001278_g7995.t1
MFAAAGLPSARVDTGGSGGTALLAGSAQKSFIGARVRLAGERSGARSGRRSAQAMPAVTAAGGAAVSGAGPAYVGIDFGTSGSRAIAIDDTGAIVDEAKIAYRSEQGKPGMAEDWKRTLDELLRNLSEETRARARGIAIDGTSGTAMLCGRGGEPQTEPLLYSDDRGKIVLDELRGIAPPNHTVLSAASTLAKLYYLWRHCPGALRPASEGQFLAHQADWLALQLHGRPALTDYNNALKLGYDVQALRYPEWLASQPVAHVLPEVIAPGEAFGEVTGEAAGRYGLPRDCRVVAGTTDSIAAFLAAGPQEIGEAVSSLGSTLAVKLLSSAYVEDARYGVYSHRLGDRWLVGGSSNAGGAVLRHFFSDGELAALSARIDPERASGLDYVPLLRPGDRFPVCDPALEPRLEPRPADDAAFLHGLLEGIARMEADGYRRLAELGASPLTRVLTAGGGAQNPTWRRIRERLLGVPVSASEQTDAAYGAALLARKGAAR